jgi:GTP-binding protein
LIFIDEAVIDVQGGRGGNGCMAFRREKFVAHGGPSGGDGGAGGDVWLIGDERLNTLYHLRFRSLYAGERGRHGEGSNKTGAEGDDREIAVPLGTLVYNAEGDELLGEVLSEGQRLLVAAGGRGGRGNARFASSTNQAPRRHEPGRDGEERRLRLELKLLADVGAVGLPNAGKSTLIRVLSAAKPKVADYPFTTLVPQLGVVAGGLDSDPFVLADLPGLIAGASAGAGLGIQFLRHVERCRVLVHLVDLSVSAEAATPSAAGESEAPEDEAQRALADLETVEEELRSFNAELLRRPRILVGSKLDTADERRREVLAAAASERGLDYLEISSATHAGLAELTGELRRLLAITPIPDATPATDAVSGSEALEARDPVVAIAPSDRAEDDP